MQSAASATRSRGARPGCTTGSAGRRFRKATLADEEVSVDLAELTTPRDRVAVVATAPLTRDGTWIPAEPDTLWVFRGGRLTHTLAS